jgi:hypothetical protein
MLAVIPTRAMTLATLSRLESTRRNAQATMPISSKLEAILGSMEMISKKQHQESGSGSQQIQVAGDLIQINGVTEERAVEIAREQSRIAIQEFTTDAADEASIRINKFDEKVVDDLSARDLLDTFADPGFQILLRKAQLQAASTPDEVDYELLSKLLSERAGKASKPIHMIVSRAVEVVEYLDSDALIGMMFLWLVACTAPSAADPKIGLAQLDGLILKFLGTGELPSGSGWLQRLALMGCIYYQQGGAFRTSMSPWPDVQLKERPGYMCEGIPPEDVDATRIRLSRIIPNLGSTVVEHQFLPGRFRINAIGSGQLLKDVEVPLRGMRAMKEQMPEQALKQLPNLTTLDSLGDREELQRILLESKMDVVSSEAKANMLKYVESELPNLQKLRVWWDGLSDLTGITHIGIAITYSNAKRFDPLTGLPNLSELIGAS